MPRLIHPRALPQPFTRAEAIAAGVSGRRLELAARRGDLLRLAPSLYAVPSAWEPMKAWDQHLSLARTAVRTTPDAIISHASAAAILGLPMPPRPPTRATMTLLDDSRTSPEDAWRRFHRGATPPEHVLIDAGHPYLIPARTVIDALRELPPRDALAIIDGALRSSTTTVHELLLMRSHQRRWPGIAAADPLLRLADARRESWLESASAWVFHTLELPLAIPQVIVSDLSGRFLGRVDAFWPELGLVGEADGRGKYRPKDGPGTAEDAERAAADAVLAQVERESRLRDTCLEVIRWEPSELGQPLLLGQRFAAAARRARPGLVSARFTCSCCHRPLTDCSSPTRIRLPRAA